MTKGRVKGPQLVPTLRQDVSVGDRLPSVRHVPTALDVFRFSAVTWNSHRIHYDLRYAQEEGYPDVLVQSHLHGAYLASLCTSWMGTNGILRSLSTSVRKFAVPGDVLECRGEVVKKEGHSITVDLIEVRLSDCAECATGTARIELSRPNESSETRREGAVT